MGVNFLSIFAKILASILERAGVVLGRLGSVLGASWGVLGASWACLGGDSARPGDVLGLRTVL